MMHAQAGTQGLEGTDSGADTFPDGPDYDVVVRFEMLSWWRVATGAAEFGGLDSRCARCAEGFPIIPGREVKGLLRDAVRRFEALGHVRAGQCQALFGEGYPQGQDEPSAGRLRFDTAHLAQQDRDALRGKDDLIEALFDTRRSTAIEGGIAKPHSLRLDEVALPVSLYARVVPAADAPGDWARTLSRAVLLLRDLGSGRTRGLGRVRVSVAIDTERATGEPDDV